MNKKINFRKRPLVFVDLETTGLNPLEHEIVEVACLVADGQTFEIQKKYIDKVKPEHIETASPEALKIIGYSESRWKDARPAREVLEKVGKLAPGGMITGWNVSFDWWFLQLAFKKHGISCPFDYHAIDVMSIAYAKLWKKVEISQLGLRKIAPHFGIKLGKEHGALEDITATYKIFKKIMQE